MYLVECYNDETVLRVLGVPKAEIRRMKGKGNVMNELKRAGAPQVGLVDRDVRSAHPVPLEPFSLTDERDGLSVHTWQNQRLVVVHDRIEDWIAACVADAGLGFAEFNIPVKDAAALHRVEMRVMDARLVRLLQEVVRREVTRVDTLRAFLGIDPRARARR